MKQSYWCYIPIVTTLILGFVSGFYLTFGVKFLDVFCSLSVEAKSILILFGMGLLGASTYCARAWSTDIYEVVYEEPKFLPHLLDFIGYITLMLGGGITGVILFFIIKTGIGISVSTNNEIQLTVEASAVIAYIGGLYHFKVQSQLGKMIDNMFKNKDEEKPSPGSGS